MVTVIFNGKNKVDKDSQNSSNIIIMDGYDGTKNDSSNNIALIKLDKAMKKTSITSNIIIVNIAFIMSHLIIFRDHRFRFFGLQRY